jgi:lipopolysaccharide/colanic/teichoic acid biosynthesis glycosyltransferase
MLTDGGRVLFRQKRVGQNGRIFEIVKFRTMKANAEQNGPQFAQKDDPRITKFGRFLRLTRLDELPQFWNILTGNLSLVGPRPERPEFVDEFEKKIPYYQVRHLIKPGLAGWAQLNYEYAANLEESYKKLQYELYYIKNRSLLLDLSILLKTIRLVLARAGR